MVTAPSPLVQRAARLSLLVAGGGLAGKLLAWFLSQGSLALLADALETTANLATAALTLWALWLSAQPADAEHPYGHDKAEYLAAGATGIFIVVSGGLILAEAIPALLRTLHLPHTFILPWPALALAAVITLANVAWGGVLMRLGQKHHSPALIADARHLWADVVTTAATLAGLLLAQLTGWGLLDPLLAVAVACHILWSGSQVMRDAASSLLDTALPAATLHQVEALLAATVADPTSAALNIHDLKTRQAARVFFLEFHLVVPGTLTVSASHSLCDALEEKLHRLVPGSQVTIHVEPENELPASAK